MTLKLLLKICAVIIWIGGAIGGFALANVEVELGPFSHYTDFLWSVALTAWLGAFLSGLVFFSLSRVIEYLSEIKERLGLNPPAPTEQPSAPAPAVDKDDSTKFQGITISPSSDAELTKSANPQSETKEPRKLSPRTLRIVGAVVCVIVVVAVAAFAVSSILSQSPSTVCGVIEETAHNEWQQYNRDTSGTFLAEAAYDNTDDCYTLEVRCNGFGSLPSQTKSNFFFGVVDDVKSEYPNIDFSADNITVKTYSAIYTYSPAFEALIENGSPLY